MFQEYTIKPGSEQVLFTRIFNAHLPVLLALMIGMMVLKYTEPQKLQVRSLAFFVFITFVVLQLISAIRQYYAGKRFRAISNGSDLSWTAGTSTVTLRYSEITRIEKDSQGTLFIYTVSSQKIPAVALSQLLLHIESLEEYLSRFVPIQPARKLPLLHNPNVSQLLNFVFLLCLLLNLGSTHSSIILGSFLVLTPIVLLTLIIRFTFLREINSLFSSFLLIVLWIVLLLKTSMSVFNFWPIP